MGSRSDLRMRGRYEGHDVNLKVTFKTKSHDGQGSVWLASLVREYRWYERLKKLGIRVPTPKGITQTPSGAYALVTEFIDGLHFSAWGVEMKVLRARPEFEFKHSMRDDILQTLNALEKAGIRPNDIQFRLGVDGYAYLVDPEYLHSTVSQSVYATEVFDSQITSLILRRRNLRLFEFTDFTVQSVCQNVLGRIKAKLK